MKNKKRQVADLEEELEKLNSLVRERRKELARLEDCPNTDCTCRAFWREHIEKNLAEQVGKIRQQIKTKPRKK